jgi:integrase
MTDKAMTTTEGRELTAAARLEALINMVAPEHGGSGMVAASSARVYRDTFKRWAKWAADNGLDPLSLNYSTVAAYMADRETSKASRQRELSALRTLAKLLAVVDYANPARKAALESLKLLKLRAAAEGVSQERQRRALGPAEADRMLRVWAADPTPSGKRNRAIIATFLLTGLRRAELAALQWASIDFHNGTIAVRHGKGDKPRDVAIYGAEALEALKAWQLAQPTGYKAVFVNLRKGDHFTGDKPMTTTSLYRIVTATAKAARVGHVKPHDLRRTLATELLSTGEAVHNVQAQLGHSDSSTTLNNYAVEADARERRKAGKLRYGASFTKRDK